MHSVSPHPSLSRDLQSEGSVPHQLHALQKLNSSILCLASDAAHIYSGNQDNDILVWDKKTFELKATLQGHTKSVLALVYAEDKKWLFSSSGDSTVRVWSTITLKPVYIIDTYPETGAGDLFSIAWSPSLQTIYIGCQNTSLQWFKFTSSFSDGTTTPNGSVIRKVHRFFDSYPQFAGKPADLNANNPQTPISEITSEAPRLAVPATNVVESEHFGYIYCMTLMDEGKSGYGVTLATGSGDETVKLWKCTSSGPSVIHTFECNYGAVLALIGQGQTLYGGCQDGHIKVLDLETNTLVRSIIVQEAVDILALSLIDSDLYASSADGNVTRFSRTFDCTASWHAHEGIVLSSLITKQNDGNYMLITGGNDDNIKIWNVVPPSPRFQAEDILSDRSQLGAESISYALAKFVSIPSISCYPSYREDCRQAAIWLKKCLTQLGAKTQLLPTSESEGTNPLVFGTFTGNQGPSSRPRLLFYGHYDVIPAPPEGWNSDPFIMQGRNGYLYGRGVTDNKGPIIAVAFAAAELLYRRALGVDVVFLIEGHEECGSTNFSTAVDKYKDQIGHIDAILVSNSTWISEDSPCITYGLRGVVHCSIEICNKLPDVHSGIDGGGVAEPMKDMINVLSTLIDKQQRVQIPGFYDCVRPQTEGGERALSAAGCCDTKSQHLSGPSNSAVISGTVKSQVSLRIVPDQKLEVIASSLCQFLRSSFSELESPNELKVNISDPADWWIGELDHPWFKALESAIHEEWGVEPLRIREGGSVPSVPYLEKAFACQAFHLPMGQSLDQAHLPNERISLNNLQRGKAVVARFLVKVAEMGNT
ncbi:Zn-dependent exopeptidase [Gymnopus androsaceus JB14]|uniref:Zn-dependent exopeptidase n=1 Tax=Gymnopus androsaceus JB14 TaxID=1447944 RepID=A0A6A4GVP9_9AGAR|nr:Zn-dependent exopeptidase [Gymnopus androsaceus JB14]